MSNKLPELQLPSDMQNDTSQREELKAASVRFLGNVKARFGEHSFQVSDINKTLDLFRRRALSKKETHKTILDTLDGHDNLRQELMDILTHPAARWGPDDFDLPTQHALRPSLDTAPQYLQPAHELQVRLPSFSNWFPLPQNDQSASLTMYKGPNGFSGPESLASSPSLPIPPPFQLPDPPIQFWTDADAETVYTNLDDDEFLAPPMQTAIRNPWETSNYADSWTNDGTCFPPNNANTGEHPDIQAPPLLPFHDHLQGSLSYHRHAESHATPTLPQQEIPHSLHPPHHTYDATPSSTDQEPLYTTKLEEYSVSLHAPPTPSSQSLPSASRTENVAESTEAEETSAVDHSQSLGGPYIHILCGKGFTTLTGVKKHHWGKKINDLATTTGCWAKHKKPDVAWDDHPSCKNRRSGSVVTKSLPPAAKQNQIKISVSQSTTPSAVDLPQSQALPGFPTLQNLPRTVAETVYTGNASCSYAEEPEKIDQTHRLASRSSFDSLLTAVNVVSQIDAPKPKGRADSIALRLDAQVAAAEQHHPFISYEPSTGSFYAPDYRAIAPAALNTASGTVMGDFSNNTSGHHMSCMSEEQPSMLSSDIEESYVAGALSRPFQPLLASLPGPARKKRKV